MKRHPTELTEAAFAVSIPIWMPAPFTVNTATCITTVAGTAFSPGRMAYDPLTNTIYSVSPGLSGHQQFCCLGMHILAPFDDITPRSGFSFPADPNISGN